MKVAYHKTTSRTLQNLRDNEKHSYLKRNMAAEILDLRQQAEALRPVIALLEVEDEIHVLPPLVRIATALEKLAACVYDGPGDKAFRPCFKIG